MGKIINWWESLTDSEKYGYASKYLNTNSSCLTFQGIEFIYFKVI